MDLPGQSFARTTTVTGMVSVPRKPGPLSTVAYVHRTSASFGGAGLSARTLEGFDHVSSWIQALPRAVRWFRTVE